MANLFISYSRKDIAYARLLHKALTEHEIETWIDWQDIPPSTEWLDEVYSAIEAANMFVFILSASSTISEICSLEIEHAKKNNKRIIPIVINDVEPSKVHPALAAINWIFSRTKDELQPAIASLIEAIQTDYDWVKAHTRLQMRALEWERADQDKSFLLQGTDLQAAEDWLTRAPGKEPEPTLLQSRYIQTSRQGTSKRQRRLLLAVSAALVITVALGIVAVINGQRAEQNAFSAEQNALALSTQVVIAEEQALRAEQQALLAHIRELTVVSQQEGLRFDIAMLLGLECYNTIKSNQTIGNLSLLNQKHPEMLRVLDIGDTYSNHFIISPDGNNLALTIDDKGILLNVNTGQKVPIYFPEKKEAISTFTISPDWKILATIYTDNELVLSDFSSGSLINSNVLKDFQGGLSFSPDGQLLAVGVEPYIYLFEVPSLELIGEPLEGYYSENEFNVFFSSDGKTVAYTKGENNVANEIQLWDVPNGQPLGELIPISHHHIHTIAFSPDGGILASAGESPVIILWDIASLQSIMVIDHGQNAVLSVSFSPDGNTLASASRDRTIKLWDVATGQAIGDPLSVHIGEVTDIEYSPDGNMLASLSWDGSIILWDMTAKTLARDEFQWQLGWSPNRFTINPDQDTLAIGDSDGVARLWNIATEEPVGEPLSSNNGGVASLAFSSDGGTLAVAGYDGNIILWDTTTLQSLYPPLSTGITSVQDMVVQFHPDGNTLASAIHMKNNQSSYEVFLWDLTAPEPTSVSFETDIRYIVSLAFNSDGSILAVGGEGAMLLDLETRMSIGHIDQLGWTTSLSFSPDGILLASGSDAATMMLWDVETQQPIADLSQVHSEPITAVVFSPDGSLMASASMDGAIYLWDVASQTTLGDALATPADGPGIACIAFSSDGGALIALYEDGRLMSWDMNITSWHDNLCGRAGRNFTQEEWDYYFPGEPYRKTCEQWPEGY